jgi:ribosomal protein S7
MQVHLEKLRSDAAEYALIRDSATDPAKKELFARLAQHLEVLANEVEQAIRKQAGTHQTCLSRE